MRPPSRLFGHGHRSPIAQGLRCWPYPAAGVRPADDPAPPRAAVETRDIGAPAAIDVDGDHDAILAAVNREQRRRAAFPAARAARLPGESLDVGIGAAGHGANRCGRAGGCAAGDARVGDDAGDRLCGSAVLRLRRAQPPADMPATNTLPRMRHDTRGAPRAICAATIAASPQPATVPLSNQFQQRPRIGLRGLARQENEASLSCRRALQSA